MREQRRRDEEEDAVDAQHLHVLDVARFDGTEQRPRTVEP